MEVLPVDKADDDLAEQLFRMYQAVHCADRPDEPPPLRDQFLARLRKSNPELRIEWLAARVGGRVVGGAIIGLPVVDNRHLLQFEAYAHPDHRRRGVGRALLAEIRQLARDEQRRTLVSGANRAVPGGPARSDAGARFLTAMGFAPALESLERRLDLPAVDPAQEQRLLADCLPHAADYEFLSWVGPTPEPLAGGVAYLVSRLNTDAPTGAIEIAESTLDAARLQADERVTMAVGTHLVAAAARHRATGDVAALTRVDVRPVGDHGSIWVTIADPRHRGHRLGTIVKIEVHRLVRRSFPELRYIYTGNADENTHMVAINERLGHAAFQAATIYQLALQPPAAG
jgi:GNAT superfamily N-acetyltransferase